MPSPSRQPGALRAQTPLRARPGAPDDRDELAPPSGPLRRLLRVRATRIALAGALLIAVELGLTAALTLSHALSPEAFAAMLGEDFDRRIRVDRVELRLGHVVRMRAEGVEVEGLGSARAAEVELRRRDLLRGRVRAKVVRLEKPRIVLRRGPHGELLPLFRTDGAGGDLAGLPAFEAGGGEIRVVQGEELTAVMQLRSLLLGRFGEDGSAPLTLAGNLTGGDGRWHTHPLQVRGRIAQSQGRLELHDGWARARHVGARWFRGEHARARFAYRDGRIEIASLDVRGFGGDWHLHGRFWLRGGMRLDVAGHAGDVDLASLLSAASGQGPVTDVDLGVLRMRWDPLQLPWRGGPRFDEGTGVGHLEVHGGRLPGTSIFASLGRRPGSTPLDSFAAVARLADGRLHSDALRLVTGDYVLEARGSVGLDRSVALEGRVDLAGDLLRSAVVPTFPVTIAGELPHPQVDAHVSRVPAGGIGAVAGAVKSTGSTVGRTTLAVGEKVGDAIGAVGRKLGGLFDR